MPSLVATIPSFIISPATYSSGAYKWASVAQTFTLSGFTTGSTITSAKLCVGTDHKGSVRVSKTVGGTEKTVNIYGDHYASASDYVDIISLFGGAGSVLNTTSWTCNFEYKAANNTAMHIQGGAAYTTPPALHLTYTLPYSYCDAPTSVTAASTNVVPGTTVRISWSGAKAGTNNPITGYYVYRSSDKSTWTKLNSTKTSNTYYDVTAPTTNGATYYYTVQTVGTVSGYDSGRSTAMASVTSTVTATKAPTTITVNPDTPEPMTSVTLSWSGASAGTNNPITGYKIYRLVASTYTEYATVTTTSTSGSYSMTSPQDGVWYFKVETLGQRMNSGMSNNAASYAVNKQYTSDYTIPSSVTIGTAFDLTISSLTNKQHVLSWIIGSN